MNTTKQTLNIIIDINKHIYIYVCMIRVQTCADRLHLFVLVGQFVEDIARHFGLVGFTAREAVEATLLETANVYRGVFNRMYNFMCKYI